ncbi:kallikrein-15-like [Leguminivora glycinivorella]|uniref:kallikrein-15-like n=1 Tax=Leguminivora glycinivorella TaxID=1035111 RepID=UPI00200D6285|nr:kallikrein-15-like [Leguminivora glycinivorella]
MNKANLERYKYFRKRSFKSDGHGNILSPIPKNYTSESRATSKKYSQTLNVVFSKTEPLTKTFVAQWSSYPFASVYVYEPKQTHCDASGISPHWLLAAGSCLSRHNLEYSIDDRSAYVTYCGVHWRSPERIAYVKRILLHPNFNLRDKVRRLLFNVGLIQVVSSMSTSCPGWTPVAMMSHQFFASSAGSMAQAVGWGLDRYGSQYATEEIPHCPLTVYEALVYHDTCPGSTTFSTTKQQGDSGAENVYCLLLPVYSGEENDSVHGGMLLVGGKMIALYLQEERRSWGSQSAQYTGVWRLLPWITDVAHEHEDVEIPIDI